MKRQTAALLLLSGLLIGCGEDTTPEKDPYYLTAMLPSPAVPGQEVILYGRLPADTRSLHLSGRGESVTLTGDVQPDGLRVTVPETLIADTWTVSVPGVTSQSLTLDVLPLLTEVRLEGDVLHAHGKGWGNQPEATVIEINGQPLTPSVKGTSLSVRLPASQDASGDEVYGTFSVRLIVGERSSDVVTVQKEAVILKGTVNRPLPTSALSTPLTRQSQTVPPTHQLIVPVGVSLPAAGLSDQTTILNRQVATYNTVEAASAALEALRDRGVEASFDQIIKVGDQGERQSVNLQSTEQFNQWFWPKLGVPDAWTRTRGTGVIVAVIDTGVALKHPDLIGRLLPGWDFVDNDGNPSDQSGHGTHVAGLIAASGRVSGVAPDARLLPVRVIGPDGGTVSDLVRGLLWAAGLDTERPNPNPAQVINLSLGTPEYSDLLVDAVQRVLSAGVIVVAATGNDGGAPYTPANIPGVIAVTSVNGPVTTYQPGYANRGLGTRLAAYGGDMSVDQDRNGIQDGILSTDIDSTGQPSYALRQGTSMAAPQVSGMAALLLADHVPTQTVKRLLEGQATDLGVTGMDAQTGWGLVNAQTVNAETQLYVIARNSTGRVITSVRTTDSAFELHNLPPNEPVTLVAGTDRNNNGVIGEAGELLSSPTVITPAIPKGALQLSLEPADGHSALPLSR